MNTNAAMEVSIMFYSLKEAVRGVCPAFVVNLYRVIVWPYRALTRTIMQYKPVQYAVLRRHNKKWAKLRIGGGVLS